MGSPKSNPFTNISIRNKNGTTCSGKILRHFKKPFNWKKSFVKKQESRTSAQIKKSPLTKEEQVKKYTNHLDLYVQMLPLPIGEIISCIEKLSQLTRKKKIQIIDGLEMETEMKDKIKSCI